MQGEDSENDSGVCFEMLKFHQVLLSFRDTTGVMIGMLSPSLVHQTTAIAVATKLPSWNWMILLNIPCKY